jgi:hypothetical protein
MPQTTLTTFQKARIAHHLGYMWNLPPLLTIEPLRRLKLDSLPAEVILATVGDIETANDDDKVNMEGVIFATKQSALGKVERALSNLSSEVIDASLYVSEAGTTKLRPNELAKRKALYNELVKQLSQLLGVAKFTDGSGHIGY